MGCDMTEIERLQQQISLLKKDLDKYKNLYKQSEEERLKLNNDYVYLVKKFNIQEKENFELRKVVNERKS